MRADWYPEKDRVTISTKSSMFSSQANTSVSLLNTSTSVRRGAGVQATPRTTPSIANRSQRAEQVLEETARHVVKALNSPVPVQVQETLRGNLSAVSVKLDASGWAWLVSGNRVLLWRYAPVQAVARCYQLGLPSPAHSSRWNADLITVCGQLSSTRVSLLATSPGGSLYYWDNILRDRPGPSVDATVDVGAGLVVIATPIRSKGVVLMTSEGCLFVVPLLSHSQSSLSPRALHVPRGMLTGLSQRVSSLFFGSSGSERAAEGRGMAVSEDKGGDGGCIVFVLTNTALQKWLIEVGREQLVYEVCLEPIISAMVLQKEWFKGQQVSAGSLSVWNVDTKLAKDYAVVLFAVTVDGSSVAEYGLALFDAHHDSAPLSTNHLIRLNHKTPYKVGREASLLTLALQCVPSSANVTVHDRNTLLFSVATGGDGSEDVTDIVTFPPPTAILGAGQLESSVVLFTTSHGVVSVSLTSPLHTLPPPSSSFTTASTTAQSQTRMSSSLLMTPTTSRGHTHQVAPPPEEISQTLEQLKDAFLDYLDGNVSEASASCQQLFPPEPYFHRGGSVGDLAVKTFSEMVLNDQPAQDPRWGEGRESLSGASLIITYQLENKLTAHSRLLQFLSDCGLMDKLLCVMVRGSPMRTSQLLCEHAEKIVAATALMKTHNQVVDQAMKACVSHWPSQSSLRPGLTHQDLFYTEVTRLDDIVPSLLSTVDTRLHALSHPRERVQVVLAAGRAMEAMLREAVQHRNAKSQLYRPSIPPDPLTLPPFTPWTVSPGSCGVRNGLSQLLEVLYDSGIRDADTPQECQEVWEVAVSLCDILLGGYQDQMLSMEHNPSLSSELAQVKKHFESARERFLSPLLEHGQYRPAVELGEKYRDFQLLVQLCEGAGDRERLKGYVKRYAEQGFAEFLFKQYLDQGKVQELLAYSEDFPRQLAKFLEPHDHLSWMHHVASQDYAKAHATLYRMAQKEETFLAKKKTQLSLSKLALLASDSDSGTGNRNGDMSELTRQLDIIEYQMNIPDSVLEAQGMELEAMPPLSPEDIVELYVGEKNDCATETDFLCVLELLQTAYQDKTCDEFQELRTYIWSQAALRDNWSQMSTDNPLDQLPSTLFFRVIQTAFYKEFELEDVLPTMDSLLASPALLEAGVAQDTRFRFLVSAGFEQLHRVQNSSIQS